MEIKGMIKGIYTSAVGMMPNKLKIDVIANNLANIDTTGFKKDNIFVRILHSAVLDINKNGGNELSGLYITEYTSFDQGNLKQTGNPFDIAINGIGFFIVKTEDGLRYTRNGNFTITADGKIVNANGHALVGNGGEIKLPDVDKLKDADIKITQKGELYINDKLIDRIKIVWFNDLSKLKKESRTYFKADDGAEEVEISDGFEIHQGFLEESNVNAIEEMVRMIEANRSYESSYKAVQHQEETLTKANELGKL
jgi:flagellar basal-body rod protein FlgG